MVAMSTRLLMTVATAVMICACSGDLITTGRDKSTLAPRSALRNLHFVVLPTSIDPSHRAHRLQSGTEVYRIDDKLYRVPGVKFTSVYSLVFVAPGSRRPPAVARRSPDYVVP